MRRTASFIAGLALLAALSLGGDLTVAHWQLAVPGPVLALIVYLVLLARGWCRFSLAAARWLAALIGALIVPPLVGVAAFAPTLAAGGWRLALALVAGTLVTGIVAAATFHLLAATRL